MYDRKTCHWIFWWRSYSDEPGSDVRQARIGQVFFCATAMRHRTYRNRRPRFATTSARSSAPPTLPSSISGLRLSERCGTRCGPRQETVRAAGKGIIEEVVRGMVHCPATREASVMGFHDEKPRERDSCREDKNCDEGEDHFCWPHLASPPP